MKIFTSFIAFFLTLAFSLTAQVEINPNHLFELGTAPTDTNQGNLCTGYQGYAGRVTDYFRAGSPSIVGMPSNIMGQQQDILGGSSYMGLAVNGYRGVEVWGMLLDSVYIGNSYRLSVTYSVADDSKYSCDSMIMIFAGNNMYVQSDVAESLLWHTHTITVTAMNTQAVVLIGPGYHDFTLARRLINPSGFEGSYYYIAELSVIDLGPVGVEHETTSSESMRVVSRTNLLGQAVDGGCKGVVVTTYADSKGGFHHEKTFK